MKFIWYLLLRKAGSLIARLESEWATLKVKARASLNHKVTVGRGCSFGSGVMLRASDGGSITVGSRVSLGTNVQLIAQAGRIVLGNDAHIGDGTIIVARTGIAIGDDALIAEYVVIRDQDHDTRKRPIRISGFQTAPIHIGNDVWIGCKASVLRGATIGDGCVIGAHSLVRSQIPDGDLAVGIPARAIKKAEGAF